jgi:hypothetical protein
MRQRVLRRTVCTEYPSTLAVVDICDRFRIFVFQIVLTSFFLLAVFSYS